MALAESTHHAALWGQKKARAGRGVRDAVHGEVPEALLPQEPNTHHVTLNDDDSVPELGGFRPDRLYEVRPQERVQQHPVGQIVDTAPALPILDVPVVLMGWEVEACFSEPAILDEFRGEWEEIGRDNAVLLLGSAHCGS